MSQQQSSAHAGDIRLTIRKTVVNGAETVGEIITIVSERCDCPERDVRAQIDELAAAGLLYRDSASSDAEVCLP